MEPRQHRRRVLLLSHHAIVRAGLKYLLSQHDGQFLIGEAENVRAAMQELAARKWDFVIMDFSRHAEHTLEIIRQSASEAHVPRTLIISPFGADNPHVKRALLEGVSGCLDWEDLETSLLKTMEWIERGKRYVDPRIGAFLLDTERARTPPHERLTKREYQVLCGLVRGKRTGEVAADLMLSPKTVYTYRKRIETKTGLKTNEEFVQYGRQHRLFE